MTHFPAKIHIYLKNFHIKISGCSFCFLCEQRRLRLCFSCLCDSSVSSWLWIISCLLFSLVLVGSGWFWSSFTTFLLRLFAALLSVTTLRRLTEKGWAWQKRSAWKWLRRPSAEHFGSLQNAAAAAVRW